MPLEYGLYEWSRVASSGLDQMGRLDSGKVYQLLQGYLAAP